jgi:type IV pilus assembly protein PilF
MKKLIAAAIVPALLSGCATVGTSSPEPSAKDSIVPTAQIDTSERRRARIRLELAAQHYQSRNYTTALDELRQALTVDPGYSAAYGMLGLIYMDLKDSPRAEESFKQALKLSPDNPDINNNYGWFLCQAGREREAIKLFERAAADPLYAAPSKPLHNAGVCLRRAGDSNGAETFLKRAFKVDPRNPVAMYNLGEIYLEREDLDRAQFYAQRLVTSHQPAPQTLWLALRIEQARGNRQGMLSLASQLRKRFPGSREADLLRQGRF